jgi:hypothetical protein
MALSSALLGLSGFLLAPPAAISAEHEAAPTLAASEILPPELLAGDHHRVVEEVANDGYMNRYVIRSDFGELAAYGQTMLSVRVQEVTALAQLDELSKSRVFLDAVGEAARAPVETVKAFTDQPTETIKGIPGGVGRMFRSLKRDVDEGAEMVKQAKEKRAHDQEEGDEAKKERVKEAEDASKAYAKKYFGISKAERQWAEELGVDPYTNNEVLRKAIKSVARVDAAGTFGTRLAMPRIPGVGYVAKLNTLVWSVDPRELREQNINRLRAAGATDEDIKGFFDHPWFSPTLQTVLITSSLELEGAKGLPLILELAKGVDSEDQAVFFVDTVRMLAGFHRTQGGLVRLVDGARVPAGLTPDGRLVLTLPTDSMFWTAEVADAAGETLPALAAGAAAQSRGLWLRGEVSSRAREGLEGLGWQVHPKTVFPAPER